MHFAPPFKILTFQSSQCSSASSVNNSTTVLMAKTRSMTRNQINMTRWSDLNHDVLYLVMKHLGVVDFVAFSGVCKSWRSLSLSNKYSFMASRPPMLIWISTETCKKDHYCYLEDFEGRRFKTILPHSGGRTCRGITCGYLILFGRETQDFWLVNPITRHELHFTDVPVYVFEAPTTLRAILVFSPLTSGWVFVMLNRFENKIWFSIAGTGAWKHVSSTFSVLDLHAFKGKIYTINNGDLPWQMIHLFEMRINPKPRLTLLETKNFPEEDSYWDFVSSGENLYLMQYISKYSYKVHEIDFGERKPVLYKKATDKYTFFLSDLKHGAAIKPESWVGPRSIYRRYADTCKSGKGRFFTANMWYFPNDCLNVSHIHE